MATNSRPSSDVHPHEEDPKPWVLPRSAWERKWYRSIWGLSATAYWRKSLGRDRWDTHIVALEGVVRIAWDRRGKTVDARRVAQLGVLGAVQQACRKLRVPLCLSHVSHVCSETSSHNKLTVLAAMLWA